MTIPHTPEHTHHPQFTTPTALMLDTRLTPLERNGWQVLRMLRTSDGLSSLASLGQLRRYLTSIPLGQKAGYETTWRVLVVLRLTGWISLLGQQRDPLTGHVLSEQYQVHEHPLPFDQASTLDPALSTLLHEATGHDNNQVARVAEHIQAALAQASDKDDDSDGEGPTLPGRQDAPTSATPPDTHNTSPSARCAPVLPQNTGMPHITDDADPTYSMYKYKNTTYRAREGQSVDNPPALPPCLQRIAGRQKHDVLVALRRLPEEQRQDVLDELQARSQGGTVRNVIAYFFGLIRRVMAGEFRLWAGPRQTPPHPVKSQPAPASAASDSATPAPEPVFQRASPDVALAHIDHLRSLLNRPVNAAELVSGFMQRQGRPPRPA
ncbi:hypothetical protein BV924_18080 [Pectobacterium odoriferum]|uniref:STY4528 family pathogenicity island replication protein n=1 Tax=Pectobacterium odoriferum TaxID=78398 RepID=UPI000CD1A0E7|nr:STY4528 family pathogenicity island replication protein [Pectobacterium odoriferum]POE09973.1 hypothetical protein BV924_18080 [Pectobacterium odoriferum]